MMIIIIMVSEASFALTEDVDVKFVFLLIPKCQEE